MSENKLNWDGVGAEAMRKFQKRKPNLCNAADFPLVGPWKCFAFGFSFGKGFASCIVWLPSC